MTRADPQGRRALFGDPVPAGGGRTARPADRDPFAPAPEEGRRAFFTAGAARPVAATSTASGPGPVRRAAVVPPGSVAVVMCRRCGRASAVDLLGLAVTVALSLWVPGRRPGRYLRCPACHRWSWASLRSPGGLSSPGGSGPPSGSRRPEP